VRQWDEILTFDNFLKILYQATSKRIRVLATPIKFIVSHYIDLKKKHAGGRFIIHYSLFLIVTEILK